MARPILQRLTHRILEGWGIVEGPDPWERGEAQAAIKADAAGRVQTLPHARLHPLSGQRLAGLMRLLAPRPGPGEAEPRCVVADGAPAGVDELTVGSGCGATPGGGP